MFMFVMVVVVVLWMGIIIVDFVCGVFYSVVVIMIFGCDDDDGGEIEKECRMRDDVCVVV